MLFDFLKKIINEELRIKKKKILASYLALHSFLTLNKRMHDVLLE
jgi:hypothetical protein